MPDQPAPRADDPRPLTPPGTDRETFWQRSATISAIAGTISFGLTLLRPLLVEWLGEAGAGGAEALVWAWAIAFGISRTSEGLRRS